MRYVVSQLAEVHHDSGVLRRGEVVDPGLFPKEHFEWLLGEGFVVEQDAPAPAPAKPATGYQTKGKWTHDPAKLADKPLAVLNVLIAKVDPDEPRAKSKKAAIELLSQDFQG